MTACTDGRGGEIVARGELENLGTDTQTYSVRVRLAPDAVEWVLVEDVPPGATVDFEAREADPSPTATRSAASCPSTGRRRSASTRSSSSDPRAADVQTVAVAAIQAS